MSPQCTLLAECSIAPVAGERLLPGVYSQVVYQRASVGHRQATFIARIRLLSRMDRHDVPYQISSFIEHPSAPVAGVRLHSAMYLHMPLELTVLVEGLGADVAGVRLEARVREHVPRHVVLLSEGLPAGLAGEGLVAGVDLPVPRQTHLVYELLIAYVAGERFI